MKRGIKFWLGLQLPLVSGAVLMTQPSHAAILWNDPQTTGIQNVDPSFWTKQDNLRTKSLTSYLGFDEVQNILLPKDISITAKNPDAVVNTSFANKTTNPNKTKDLLYNWDNVTINTLPTISKGVTVSSHFIYIQPPNTFKPATPTSPQVDQIRINPKATIVFDAPIIGLMGDPLLINPTNNLFVPNYDINKVIAQPSAATLEGLDWFDPKAVDYAKIRGTNNNILELDWSSQGLDSLRVITSKSFIIDIKGNIKPVPVKTAPEPLTILGSATAIGFGTFFRNLKKKQVKQNNTARG